MNTNSFLLVNQLPPGYILAKMMTGRGWLEQEGILGIDPQNGPESEIGQIRRARTVTRVEGTLAQKGGCSVPLIP